MRIGFRLRCRAESTLSNLRSGASGVNYTSLEATDDWSGEKRGWQLCGAEKETVCAGRRQRMREGDRGEETRRERERDREARIGPGGGRRGSHFIFAQTPATAASASYVSTAPCLPRVRKVLPCLFLPPKTRVPSAARSTQLRCGHNLGR